jgi:hypothetical protein
VTARLRLKPHHIINAAQSSNCRTACLISPCGNVVDAAAIPPRSPVALAGAGTTCCRKPPPADHPLVMAWATQVTRLITAINTHNAFCSVEAPDMRERWFGGL